MSLSYTTPGSVDSKFTWYSSKVKASSFVVSERRAQLKKPRLYTRRWYAVYAVLAVLCGAARVRDMGQSVCLCMLLITKAG